MRGESGPAFPAARGPPPSDSTLSNLLRELSIGAVPHGFRTSVCNRAAECPDAARGICELALANVNSDRVEAACLRTDLFGRRRMPTQEWADYLV